MRQNKVFAHQPRGIQARLLSGNPTNQELAPTNLLVGTRRQEGGASMLLLAAEPFSPLLHALHNQGTHFAYALCPL